MCVLSYRASKTYLDAIEANYRYEQYSAGNQAVTEKNYLEAIRHYKNLVYASQPTAPNVFVQARSLWTLSFPFASEILIKIKAHSDQQGMGRKREYGINHGLLAYALEKYGMIKEADAEWEIASKLLGQPDLAKVKQLIENINKT